MATRYAVFVSDPYSLWSDTAMWSTSSGGAGGASVPTSSDDVIIDANSMSPLAHLSAIKIDPTIPAVCHNLTITGVMDGNLATLAGGTGPRASLTIYGSFDASTHTPYNPIFNPTYLLGGLDVSFVSPNPGEVFDLTYTSPDVSGPYIKSTFTFNNTTGSWQIKTSSVSSITLVTVTLSSGTLILNKDISFTFTNFNANGSASNQLHLQSSSPGNPVLLSVATPISVSASFTYSPNPGVAGQTETFTDTSTLGMFSYMTVTDVTSNGTQSTFIVYPGGQNGGGNTGWSFDTSTFSWFWDFGDSNTSTLQNPTHIYSTPADYSVELDVTTGASSGSAFNTVSILNSNFYLQTVTMVGV